MNNSDINHRLRKSWLRVTVTTGKDHGETIASFITSITGLGIETAEDPGLSRIIVYLPEDEPSSPGMLRNIENFLKNRFQGDDPPPTITTKTIIEENWGESWKKKFKPFKATDHLVIKPSWEIYQPESDEQIIEIDPGLAFGTGLHPTTRLVLSFLDSLLYGRGVKANVLDIGCGTGILAMGAVLLGAQKVVAIDNDPDAVQTARDNIINNNLGAKIIVSSADIREIDEQFDLIAANIIHNTLVELAEIITSKIKQNGNLILSGILGGEQEHNIIRVFGGESCRHLETRQEKEWVAILFQKM